MSSSNLTVEGFGLRTSISVVPAVYAAGTVNGTPFERTNYLSCQLVQFTGANTGTVDCKLQHSDTQAGTYTDFNPTVGGPNAGVCPQLTAANQTSAKNIDLVTAKAWVRAVQTAGAAGTAAGAVIVFGNAVVAP